MSNRTTEVGLAIRKAREDRGLTRQALADLSGVDLKRFVDWELNGVYPGLYNLIPVADALNISLDELVGRKWTKNETEIIKKTKNEDPKLVLVTEHYGYKHENYQGRLMYVVYRLQDGEKIYEVTGKETKNDARNSCALLEKMCF